ncbi:MAG: phosphoribosylglycinamide formyltransferase [Gemmatimonadetes bacterium]|nr:phosphoribosylglycinamide formyltransferase [Gemmatimonadota bacterium]
MTTRIAVFASGGGTNLQALIDHFHPQPAPAARVELVVANRPGIGALDRANAAGVRSAVLVPADTPPGELLWTLDENEIDLIVLAGYLQLLPTEVIARYHERVLNIHPALLPSFGGLGMYGNRVHRAVLQSGARVSGATVHLVDDEYDRGRILAQWPVPVLPGDTPEELAARVLRVEHRLLPLTVEALLGAGDVGVPVDPLSFGLLPIDAPAPDDIAALHRVRETGSMDA